jgi:hypothetical protein
VLAHAVGSVTRDDQVIEECDLHHLCGICQPAGENTIALTGLAAPARVIVGEDERGSAKIECTSQKGGDVHVHLINTAMRDDFVSYQAVSSTALSYMVTISSAR